MDDSADRGDSMSPYRKGRVFVKNLSRGTDESLGYCGFTPTGVILIQIRGNVHFPWMSQWLISYPCDRLHLEITPLNKFKTTGHRP
jgi:hypothetical protein